MFDDPKLEEVPDWIDLPDETERSWDMRETLETELPDEPPPGWYESEYDEVLKVAYDGNELKARLLLTALCQKRRLTPVGDVFVTAKYYCIRVRR